MKSATEKKQIGSQKILDACCGSRMMWFDKTNPHVLFFDVRNNKYEIKPDKAHPKGTTIVVMPDVVGNFAAMPFDDESFVHVVFDPPHIQRAEQLGTITKKYGTLVGDWRSMLRDGFKECFRVLKHGGTLIFKWCETEIAVTDVLALTDHKPLYGHRSGKKAQTHWIAFVK